jgi:hypothetical protein
MRERDLALLSTKYIYVECLWASCGIDEARKDKKFLFYFYAVLCSFKPCHHVS